MNFPARHGAPTDRQPRPGQQQRPPTANQPVRLGIVGTGHLGRIHARLARQLPEARLVGVADPQADARNAAAAETGTRPFANFLELANQIDAAIVATPTRTHESVAAALASRGVHLLVEKPLAATCAEADRLVTACQRNGVTLQVGHVERFNPAFHKAVPYLTEPKYIEAIRVSGYPFRSTDIGVVLDLMIHDLDVILTLVRAPLRQVDALGLSVFGKDEDVAQARLTFEDGCVANLTASRVSYAAKRRMQIWTPRTVAAVDFATRTTTLIDPNQRVLDRTLDLDALTNQQKLHLKEHLFDELLVKQTFNGAEVNAIADEQRDFLRCIRTGAEPVVCGTQGRDAVAVAERVLELIANHQWDGTAGGRSGALAVPQPPILQGPHWHAVRERRRAG